MEQIERILKMVDEFSDVLKKQFGNYKVEVEVIMGRKKVILTDSNGERSIMGLTFSEDKVGLVSIPEGEEEEIGLTQLERELLQKVGNRAVYNFQDKFSARTDWQLTDLVAIFIKGSGRVILSYNEGEYSITEGDVDDLDDMIDS